MVQNGKIDKNPTGSSHGEQLEPKRLTLRFIIMNIMIVIKTAIFICESKPVSKLSKCWCNFLQTVSIHQKQKHCKICSAERSRYAGDVYFEGTQRNFQGHSLIFASKPSVQLLSCDHLDPKIGIHPMYIQPVKMMRLAIMMMVMMIMMMMIMIMVAIIYK